MRPPNNPGRRGEGIGTDVPSHYQPVALDQAFQVRLGLGGCTHPFHQDPQPMEPEERPIGEEVHHMSGPRLMKFQTLKEDDTGDSS